MAGTREKTRGKTNCTLAYGSGTDRHVFSTRARGISHGFEVIATESQARRYRAFYPHQRALSPFSVEFELIGYNELKSVMGFFRSYIEQVLLISSKYVTVSVPSRDFFRAGVPIGGVIDTDHTGSNVFMPVITFESITDPLDTRIFTTIGPHASISTVDLARTERDDASKFFYPPSAAVNDPNSKGDTFYDTRPAAEPDWDPPPDPNRVPSVVLPDGTVRPGGRTG